MPLSSFQELMKLITANLDLKSPEEKEQLLAQLLALRQTFNEDEDLLIEAIIRTRESLRK